MAWIEVIGPLNASCLKNIDMTFPDVRMVVSASRGIPIPRRILHHFTYRCDDKAFWQMDDIAPKACKLLVECGAELQSFRLYFHYNRIDRDEEWLKYLWAVEEIRKALALPPEQIRAHHSNSASHGTYSAGIHNCGG